MKKIGSVKNSVVMIAMIATISASAQKNAGLNSEKLEKNKQVVIAMNELFNTGKSQEAMQFYSDSLTKKGNIGGRSFFVAMQDDIQTTFPDVQTKINDIWADGDWVIANCTFSGTHKGIARLPHHGGLLIGKEPANKHFSVQHIRMYKLINGVITERRAVRDDIGMYQQLGLMPMPEPMLLSGK